MRDFKPNKSHCTALVGGNMVGKKHKPLVIGVSDNPRDMTRGKVDRSTLSYYCKANKKAWMTSSIYWNYFIGILLS